MDKYIPSEDSRFKLTLKIVLVYAAATTGFVFLVGRYSLLASAPDGAVAAACVLILGTLYYAVPILAGAALGFIFRPFLRNFFKCYVLIIILQFAVSLAVYGLREQVAGRWQDDISRSRTVFLRFKDFSHQLSDQNKDGHLDQAGIEGRGEMGSFPPGEYSLDAFLMQKGRPLVPDPVASLKQTIVTGKPRRFRVSFKFDLQPFDAHFNNGEVEIVLSLKKKMRLMARDRKIVAASQLIPFLRSTPWGQDDPLLAERMIDLGILRKVDTLRLDPINFR